MLTNYKQRKTLFKYPQGSQSHIAKVCMILGWKALPPSVQIHHVDYDATNNSNSNLVVCPNAEYHRLLHTRTEAYNTCGNADFRKCAYCKGYDSPENLKFKLRKDYKLPMAYHAKCHAAYQNKLYHKKKERQNG